MVQPLSFGSLLYGREEAVEELRDAYLRRRGNFSPPELVLIRGEAGSGKSALAQQTLSRLVVGSNKDRGYFVSGKFSDPVSSSSSSSSSISIAWPLVVALAVFIHEVQERAMEFGRQEIETIRQAIDEEFYGQGQMLLCRMIPGVDELLHNDPRKKEQQQEELTAYKYKDGSDAVKVVLSKFILCLSSLTFPMVLFLDDLQWSDDLTLEIIKDVLMNKTSNTRGGKNLFLVGAVRDGPMPSTHPLSKFLSSLDKGDDDAPCKIVITSIVVTNLTPLDLSKMVSDMFKCSQSTTQQVVDRVFAQTGGNAMFVQQALRQLCDDHVLTYRQEEKRWVWGELGLLNTTTSDTILDTTSSLDCVDLISRRMLTHGEMFCHCLKIAACLGTKFPLHVFQLAASSNISGMVTVTDLVEEGYLTEQDNGMALQWYHDSMLQAAFSLIPEIALGSLYLLIGQTLMEKLSPALLEDNIFLVLVQLSNAGVGLMPDKHQRYQVAQLCLRGGNKAALASSFAMAAFCLQMGIRMLGVEGWHDEYALALSMHNAGAEAAFCIGAMDDMDHCISMVLQHAKSLDDVLQVRTLQILSLGIRGRTSDALAVGLHVLKCLGINFPRKDNTLYLLFDLLYTRFTLRSTKDRTWRSLPELRDERKRVVMVILVVFALICNDYRPYLVPLVAMRMIRMTRKYGQCPASAQAYIAYGVCLLHFGQRKEAFRFGQLALDIVQNPFAKEYLPRTLAGVYYFINPWNRPLRESLEPLNYTYRVALETGDMEMAVRTLGLRYGLLGLWAGQPLLEEHNLAIEALRISKLYQNQRFAVFLDLVVQRGEILLGRVDMLTLSAPLFGHLEQSKDLDWDSRALVWAVNFRLWLTFYMSDYSLAWTLAAESRAAMQKARLCEYYVCLQTFFEGMIAVALVQQKKVQWLTKRQYVRTARKSLKALKQWEKDAPDNCQNKVLLLEAELEAYHGNMEAAMAKYTSSAACAQRQGFLHEEALAKERAGLALNRCGDYAGAKSFLWQARNVYQTWGADIKVRQMDTLYGVP